MIICQYISDDTSKVLRDTSTGRKRRLSLYRSRKDIEKNSRKIENEKSQSYIEPKYMKIDNDCSSEEIDVVNSTTETIASECEFNGIGDDINIAEENGNNDLNASDNCRQERLSFHSNYKMKCVRKLKDDTLLNDLVNKLDEEGNLTDFMDLICQLSTGELPANNIVLLLLLDRVRFQKCGNTVGMRYRNVTKLFWSIVYRLCKGVGLKFFGGEKNWGQVVSKECAKSKYLPNKSKVNFAVPDEKIIRDLSFALPKVIPPGKIRSTMEMIRNKEDIILMGDGKLVTRGLKSDFCGDIDLFGHEKSPNLNDLKDYMDRRIDFISDSIKIFPHSSNADKFNIIYDLTDLVTEMLQRVRDYYKSERKKLGRYMEGNYTSKPDKAISACKTNIYTCTIWIFKSLRINEQLFKMMATLRKNCTMGDSVKTVDIRKCYNIRLLHESEYVCSELDKREFPHLIKKYSEEWNELMRESIVTDDSICDSLGLNGTNKLNKYANEYLKCENEGERFKKTQMSNGELDVIAMISCIYLPSLMPSCAVMYEEGCCFWKGKYYPKLLAASPLAVIR